MAILALMAPVAFANAQNKKARKQSLEQAASGQGYGVAGCGLGSIVFGPQGGPVQIVAVTLNGTGMQTSAITTGTSNCDIPEMGQQAALFIEINQENVRTELARGQGETVSSLAYILKCSDSQLFGTKMRENYGTILENGISTYETTRRILKTIENNADLKTTCEAQG
jgi:hypothetical protein